MAARVGSQGQGRLLRSRCHDTALHGTRVKGGGEHIRRWVGPCAGGRAAAAAAQATRRAISAEHKGSGHVPMMPERTCSGAMRRGWRAAEGHLGCTVQVSSIAAGTASNDST